MRLLYNLPYRVFLYGLEVFFTFTLLLSQSGSLSAQTALTPGQVAIVGFNTSGGPSADNFAFILLTDVEEGTVIYFTDSGVKSDGCLRNVEGIMKWTAPAGGCEAGTMVSMYCDAVMIEGPGTANLICTVPLCDRFSLNVSGDQLIIFQHGTESELETNSPSPCPDQYIFALTNNETWQATATDSHTSDNPFGDDNTTYSVAIPKTDGKFNNNASFDCNVYSGSAEEILAIIVDPNSWIGNDTQIVPLPTCTFTIGDLFIDYITYNQVQLSWGAIGSGLEMIILMDDVSIVDEPSASSYSVGDPIGAATVVYVGDEDDTNCVITGLTEGQTCYFKVFIHTKEDTDWGIPGASSIPESITTYVQDPTVPSVTLRSATNTTVDFSWTNYTYKDYQADWWNGGIAIIGHPGDAVTTVRGDLAGENTSTLTVNQDLGDDNFVAAIVTNGDTLADAILPLLCTNYHFKIFHNDDIYWSAGVDFGTVTTRCPEIKVEGNNVVISKGDATPSLTDHTDFGEVLTGSSLARTFKIKNIGTGTLNLSGAPVSVSGSSEFSVAAQPGSNTLIPLAETTFQVLFNITDACSVDPYVATVSIENNDDFHLNNPFTFAIKGSCVTDCFTMSLLSGTAGAVVTITGAGFDAGTNVTFDGVEATINSFTSTQLEVVVPEGVSESVWVETTSVATPISCSQFNVISSSGTCPH
jgi:hypothetical protein